MKTIRNAVILLAAFAVAGFGQSNRSIWLTGLRCSATPTTLAVTASGLRGAATGNGGIQFWTVDNATGTLRVTCPIEIALRLGSGSTINSVDLYYGMQTTAPTAMAAAVVNTVAYPTAGAAASGTVASAGGSLTVSPAVLQITATTTGVCYHEHIVFGTAYTPVPDKQLTVEHTFTFGANTGTIEICGIQVNYTDRS